MKYGRTGLLAQEDDPGDDVGAAAPLRTRPPTVSIGENGDRTHVRDGVVVHTAGPLAAPAETPRRQALRLLIWIGMSAVFTLLLVHQAMLNGKLVVHPHFPDVAAMNDGLARLDVFYHGGAAALIHHLRTYPPDSPLVTLLSTLGFAVFGIHEWAPYAANGFLILALLIGLDRMTGRTTTTRKLLVALLALTVPIAGRLIWDLDAALGAGLIAAAGAALLVARPFVNSAQGRRLLIGALFGAAAVADRSSLPVIAAMALAALFAASVCDLLMPDDKRRGPVLRALPLAWIEVIGAAVLLTLAVAALNWRVSTRAWRAVFRAQRTAWASRPSDLARAGRDFFAANGGGALLGRHLYLCGGVIALALLGLVVAAMRSRAARVELLRAVGMFVVLLAVLVASIVQPHAVPAVGCGFAFLLLFTMACVVGAVPATVDNWIRHVPTHVAAWVTRYGSALATLLLATAVAAGFVLGQFPPKVYIPGSAMAAARRRVVEQINRALLDARVEPSDIVYFTTTGYVNPETIDFLRLQQGEPRLNARSQPTSDDLAVHEREIDGAQFVVASERGNGEAYEGFARAGLIQDQTLAYVRNHPGFTLVAQFATATPHPYFLFRRPAPLDLHPIEGLGPMEGPYPQWQLGRVRWGLGSASRIRITPPRAGRYHLIISARAPQKQQAIAIALDGREIGDHAFTTVDQFEQINLPLDLSAGEHELKLSYTRPQNVQDHPRSVLFRRLQIVPDKIDSSSATTAPAAAAQQ